MSTASFLRALAVIRFALRAASTLEYPTGEQQVLRKFSANFTCRFISTCILCAQCECSRFYMIYGILRNRANFNENPSMPAIVKILQARATEHLSKFCEQIEQRPKFVSM